MKIKCFATHESFLFIRGDVDLYKTPRYLILRAKDSDGRWTPYYQTIDLGTSSKTVTHAIIKLAGRCMTVGQLPAGHTWHGPFISGKQDVKVTIPPWDSFEEFKETLSYLKSTRRNFEAVLEDPEIEVRHEYVSGLARDEDEFIDIWLDDEQKDRLIEIQRA